MSGGGGGIIIIKNLIDNPSTTAEEKERLREIFDEATEQGRCPWLSSFVVGHIARKVSRRT